MLPAEQLFGCDRNGLLGRPFTELLEETGRDKLSHVMGELDRRGQPRRYLWIAGGLAARTDKGDPFLAEATLSTFEMQRQEFYTLILRNVNDRLEAERRIQSLEDQTAYLREEIKSLGQFEQILGSSPALLSVLKEVDQVCGTDATVLLLGETGTGKELFARAIHEGSSRRRESLITVNCAAIPTNLIESELFGHEKGSFTGATQRRDGRFRSRRRWDAVSRRDRRATAGVAGETSARTGVRASSSPWVAPAPARSTCDSLPPPTGI